MMTLSNKSVLTGVILSGSLTLSQVSVAEVTNDAVTKHYANLAFAMYDDSLTAAKDLQKAVNTFVGAPSSTNLELAKDAYANLRVSYQQSEVLRFDSENGHVSEGLDADGGPESVDAWEGQVNAWPLDEALIDYVSTGYEGQYSAAANIINTTSDFSLGGTSINVTNITPEVLVSLNEIGGSEANVATGIHAIEFLLWGQDTNGTAKGAGSRPVSDYFGKGCTSGTAKNGDSTVCKRRGQYLKAASQLLVNDLEEMAAEWSPKGQSTKGTLGYDLLTRGDGVQRIIDSMGDMAVGELASERMKVAVLFGSTEDEHDCFSDLTHIAIENNARGVINAYTGTYVKSDGTILSGPSLSDLVGQKDASLDAKILKQLNVVAQSMQAISARANAGFAFDQIVGGTQSDKNLVLAAAESLVALGDPLSDQVAPLLKVKAEEFDPGTCPGGTFESCES